MTATTRRSAETGTVGEMIDGRYRILGLLGLGAMGCVYRAEAEDGDAIAIKLLHPDLGQADEFARRFEREALATARVHHPNCVEVRDFGALPDGRLYLAMELLGGSSLARVLQNEGRLAPERALRIARHILRGLAHAHDQGILHRDLKPENIVLEDQGDEPELAKILDFGLAKLVGDAAVGQEALTRAGLALGTPTYMAPEWIERAHHEPRGDLYSLSVLVYELVTGSPPFVADDRHAVVKMHLGDEVPAMAERAPDASIPPAVEALVKRGLEKRPEDRIPSARAYLELVDRVLEDPAAALDAIRKVGEPADAHTANGTSLMFGLSPGDAPSPQRAPAAAGAAGAPAAPGWSAAAAAPDGPSPVAPAPAPPPGIAHRRPRRWTRNQIAALALGLSAVAIVAVAVAVGASRPEPVQRVLRAWDDAGLTAGGFAEVSAGPLAGCRAGAVSGVPVTLCAYGDPGAARAAAEGASGRVAVAGSMVLVVRPQAAADPGGAVARSAIEAFTAAAPGD